MTQQVLSFWCLFGQKPCNASLKAASPPSPSSPMTPAHKYFSVIWAEAIAKIPQFH
ncbi:hypothetical protein MC7420_7415 [Coleofasciculus chthonoplastes PCC 7420]|uniref:Uncharacterized protein n=1 Tax=Coleofasciculus chthonoplastes PCC 7420 TaxID=118168 RepID=B4VHF6_9CYAN|nr:hypothetical protein MC7420_7415 [Coleofasciculus chthonoplastes PCC 7420]